MGKNIMKCADISAIYAETDAKKKNRTPRPIRDERIGRQIGRFKDRLEHLITDVCGDSIRSFADRAGLADGTLRNYIEGKRFPDLDILAVIADAGNVNLGWIATGDGPMRGESTSFYGHVDRNLLREAVALVEELGADRPIDRKAATVAAVYERYAAGEPIGSETVRRLVETLI